MLRGHLDPPVLEQHHVGRSQQHAHDERQPSAVAADADGVQGPGPGHGGFFKWDDTHRSPKLSLHGNVFRVDQTPNHGSLGLPAGYQVSCSDNTIVWLGGGAFPEAASWLSKCPDTKIVTTKSTWDDAVAAWNVAH